MSFRLGFLTALVAVEAVALVGLYLTLAPQIAQALPW